MNKKHKKSKQKEQELQIEDERIFIQQQKVVSKKIYKEGNGLERDESSNKESMTREETGAGTCNMKSMNLQDQNLKFLIQQGLNKKRGQTLNEGMRGQDSRFDNFKQGKLTIDSQENQAFLIRKSNRRKSKHNNDGSGDEITPNFIEAVERRVITQKSLIKRKRRDKFDISEQFFEGINLEKRPSGNFKYILDNSIKIQKKLRIDKNMLIMMK
eukprot:403344732